MALADAVLSFTQDADLEVCLSNCKICMPDVQEERADQLIRASMEANVSGTRTPLRPMLAPNLDVIQVHSLCVEGAPVGAPHYSNDVREYVRNQCGIFCKDVEKMQVWISLT
jgi:hypothetical protein